MSRTRSVIDGDDLQFRPRLEGSKPKRAVVRRSHGCTPSTDKMDKFAPVAVGLRDGPQPVSPDIGVRHRGAIPIDDVPSDEESPEEHDIDRFGGILANRHTL